MKRLTDRYQDSDCRENDIAINNPKDKWRLYNILDLDRIDDKELLLQIAERLADYEDEAEQRENGCDYCNGVRPLTDKVYEDGSKFDDSRGIRIEKFGKMPILSAYVKEKYFRLTFQNGNSINKYGLSDDDIKLLSSKWAVDIKYCPICGKRLKES